jgi:hypothetical protein
MDGVLPQHNANDTASAKIPELQAQDIVTISFTGRLAITTSSQPPSPLPPSGRGEEMGPIFQVASRWTIVIGDRDVVNAVEMGVRFMTHRTARVYSYAKFALGPGTRTWSGGVGGEGECTVPPNANIFYDITIDDIVTTVNDRTLLEVARTRKMIGNDIFRHEHISQHEFAKQRTLQQYKKAIAVLESLLQSKTATDDNDNKGGPDPGTADFRAEVWQCLLDCRNNFAAVHLSCHDYHAAKLACIETLQLDPANGTALVRAAKACLYDPSSSFVEASAALRSAQDVLRDNDDNDTAVLLQSLQRQLHQRRAVHKTREREMASKMARGVTAQVPGDDASTLALPKADGRHQRQKTDRQRRWPISSLSSSSWMIIIVPVVGILLAVLVPLLMARYQQQGRPAVTFFRSTR